MLYALHGYSIGAEQWTHEIQVPQTIEGAFALGSKEMIVVLPDSKSIYNGSMYSSSVTTGDFEKFIWHDVVAYIDTHYRTIPDRQSRGLVGHSMGGYGASRIGMKHPEVFGALYIMSPCCMSPMATADQDPAIKSKNVRSPARRRLPRPSHRPISPPRVRVLARLNTRQRRRGRPTPRILPCISTCQPRTAFHSQSSRQSSRPTRLWPLLTSTSAI